MGIISFLILMSLLKPELCLEISEWVLRTNRFNIPTMGTYCLLMIPVY